MRTVLVVFLMAAMHVLTMRTLVRPVVVCTDSRCEIAREPVR